MWIQTINGYWLNSDHISKLHKSGRPNLPPVHVVADMVDKPVPVIIASYDTDDDAQGCMDDLVSLIILGTERISYYEKGTFE